MKVIIGFPMLFIIYLIGFLIWMRVGLQTWQGGVQFFIPIYFFWYIGELIKFINHYLPTMGRSSATSFRKYYSKFEYLAYPATVWCS